MHFCRITGDSADKVKRKTVEEFYIWLEEAYNESKKK